MSAPTTPGTAQGHSPDRLLPALVASREVRWSATSGLLIAAGYLAGPLGAPGVVSTVLFVAGRWSAPGSSPPRRSRSS